MNAGSSSIRFAIFEAAQTQRRLLQGKMERIGSNDATLSDDTFWRNQSWGVNFEGTLETLSAPWDRRMLPVTSGEAVCPFVAEWAIAAEGVVAVPFDPSLSFPTDLASCWPPTDAVAELVEVACSVRDAEGWLAQRPARTELPED